MVRKKSLKKIKLLKLQALLHFQMLVAAVFSTLSLIIFLKIGSEVIEQELLVFDSIITNFVYSFRTPAMTKVMMSLTSLGSPLFLGFIFLIFVVFLYTRRRKDVFIYSVILYSGVVLNFILKLVFERPRPLNLPLIHENTYSFPSGHAMDSFVFYFALSYFIFRETGSSKFSTLMFVIAGLIVFLVGISRIYLGVHYPSDVLAGYIAGFMWLISAILFEKVIIYKRVAKFKK